MSADSFLRLGKDYNPCIILVKCNNTSITVEDAKHVVLRRYKPFVSLGNAFIHHYEEDNVEVSKLSALYGLSFICDKLRAIKIPFEVLHKTVSDLIDVFFSRKRILQFSLEMVFEEDMIDAESILFGSHYCNYELTFSRSRQILIQKTIQRLCELICFEIYRQEKVGVMKYHGKFYSDVSIPCGKTSKLFEKICFKAINTHLSDITSISRSKITLPIHVDHYEWRQEVAEEIYMFIRDKNKEIAGSFMEMYMNAVKDLDDVWMHLNDFKNLCRPKHMFDCKCFFLHFYNLEELTAREFL